MKPSIQLRDWRSAIHRAFREIRPLPPVRLAGCLAIAALNLLWHGHGVLRSWPPAARFAAVAILGYIVTTMAEFIWLVFAPAPPPSLAERIAAEPPPAPEPVDPLIQQLREVHPAVLKEGTLQLAEEMRSFEAGSDQEFVNTLLRARPLDEGTEAQHDEALDRESKELVEHHLLTWRAYRDRFYRPARAFRDELRRRLGIRNPRSEPEIPALDQAALTGANPIAEAADHLVDLARRLK